MRVVCHAAGGGHGHVLRQAAIATRLARLGFDAAVAGPARLAPWARASGVAYVPLADPRDAARLPLPDLLLVDVFPRGVVAELVPVLGRCPAWLVTRRVPTALYLHPPVREAVESAFEVVLWTEEPPPGLEGLRTASVRTGPALLDGARLPRGAARDALGATGDAPLVLGLGSGPPALQAATRRMLGKVARRIGARLRFASDVLDGADRLFPAARWLAGADAVVSAGGYHAFHEVAASGVPAAFLPQARSWDDQAWRVREFPAPSGPEDLEAVLSDLVRRGPGPGLRFPDGASEIARLAGERLPRGAPSV